VAAAGRQAGRPLEHELADCEVLMDSIVGTLGRRRDEHGRLRRIESMAPDAYEHASYYERWPLVGGDDPHEGVFSPAGST
jgi:hypothetical protein